MLWIFVFVYFERAWQCHYRLSIISCVQVSDFLSGRSPLTLALRVGDHMMFVQLQLAAQQTVPSVSKGPTGTSQTPTGMGSHQCPQHLPCERDPEVFKTQPDPPSPPPNTLHTHSAHSPAPATPNPQVSSADVLSCVTLIVLLCVHLKDVVMCVCVCVLELQTTTQTRCFHREPREPRTWSFLRNILR